jgi:hypothetical protein
MGDPYKRQKTLTPKVCAGRENPRESPFSRIFPYGRGRDGQTRILTNRKSENALDPRRAIDMYIIYIDAAGHAS